MTTMSSGGYPTPPCFQTEAKCLTICCLLLGDFFFFLLFMSCSAVLFCGEKNKMTWQFSFLFFMLFCFDDGEKSQGNSAVLVVSVCL